MIIFLYGQDDFRSSRKLKEIIEHYQQVHQSKMGLNLLDLEEQSFEDFRDRFQTKTIFQQTKLFVLKNAFTNKDFEKGFLDQKTKFLQSKNVIVFYQRGEVDKKDPLFVFLNKKAKVQKFEPLKQKELLAWIIEGFDQRKRKIKLPVAKLLLQFTGNDLWRISREIEKLAVFKKGEILKKDVELLVHPDLEQNIFKTIDLIAWNRKKEALNSIQQHLEKGDSPLYLLSMISYQFRRMLVMKDHLRNGGSIWHLGWHPFAAKKTYYLSKRFTFDRLKDIYQKILKTDLEIKSGRIDPETGLELLLSQI
jgi:DNA polymerase III delta subunit